MSISAVLFTNCDPAMNIDDPSYSDKTNTPPFEGGLICDMRYRPNKLKIIVSEASLSARPADIRKLRMIYAVGENHFSFDSCNPNQEMPEFSDIQIHNVNGNVEVEFVPESFNIFRHKQSLVSIQLQGRPDCDSDEFISLLDFENQTVDWKTDGEKCEAVDSGIINI